MPAASSNEPARHCKQPTQRNGEKPEIDQGAHRCAAYEPDNPAGQHAEPARAGGDRDPIEKENDLRTFAQHGDPDDQSQRI